MKRLTAKEFLDKATNLYMKRKSSVANILFLSKSIERFAKMTINEEKYINGTISLKTSD